MSPRYERVPDEPQLPTRRQAGPRADTALPPEPVESWTTITTTVPAGVRRELTLACAVHEVKLKDAVTQALRAWLAEHPPRL